MLNLIVAGLAFSAPPSLTRRDMIAGVGAGFGAAAAMVQAPAFAAVNKYAGSADRKKAEKLAAEKAKLGDQVTPYELIMQSARENEKREKAEKEAMLKGSFSGVSVRGSNP